MPSYEIITFKVKEDGVILTSNSWFFKTPFSDRPVVELSTCIWQSLRRQYQRDRPFGLVEGRVVEWKMCNNFTITSCKKNNLQEKKVIKIFYFETQKKKIAED